MSAFIKVVFSIYYFIFFILISLTQFSCNKDREIPLQPSPLDSLPTPTGDTISLIRKLEEVYQTSSSTSAIKTLSFYYDSQKRITALGIKNYQTNFDTGTVRLFYSGNNGKPYMVITPNAMISQWGSGTMAYDTTYFFYNVSSQIIKDSSYGIQKAGGNTWRRLLTRLYNYVGNTSLTIQTHQKLYNSNTLTLTRSDTVSYNPDTTFERIKVSYPRSNSTADAILKGFTYTNIINPLAIINISGLHYSWVNAPNDLEILGNSNYKTVSNTNILPRYIDFASPRLPARFFNSHYNSIGGFINGDEFNITIVPWGKRISYPQSITVTGSSSYPGDKFIYNYSY